MILDLFTRRADVPEGLPYLGKQCIGEKDDYKAECLALF